MAKHAGAYKSEKRKKELSRQKKREEKRSRRINKGTGEGQEPESASPEEKESSENA